MITKITAGLLAVTLLAACETTKTTQRTTLREMNARLASADTTSTNTNEPAPPAEGPEDIPAEGPRDLIRNPALVPTPLLRVNAAGQP
jgi:uncharacterized lipoprotein